jgi:ribosomal protein S8
MNTEGISNEGIRKIQGACGTAIIEVDHGVVTKRPARQQQAA